MNEFSNSNCHEVGCKKTSDLTGNFWCLVKELDWAERQTLRFVQLALGRLSHALLAVFLCLCT